MYETSDTSTTTRPTAVTELEQLIADRDLHRLLPSAASYHDDPEVAMIDRRILAGLVTP